MALAHAQLTWKIIGAFFSLFNELGHGYSEKVYRRALAIVLRELGLEAIEEQPINVFFHRALVGEFHADIVVNGRILIEIKAGLAIEPWHEAQILNYLTAAGGGIGLLVNFGHEVTYKRFAMGKPSDRLPNLTTKSV